jgi:hypothetical protein
VRRGHTTAGTYALRVQGRLDPRWASRFDGCALASHDDGTTVITGSVPDQAALHALLHVLRDLGLPLLSVTSLDAAPAPSPPAVADAAAPQPPRSPR